MATDKQLNFVASLCKARTQALTAEGQTPESVIEVARLLGNRDVSDLIDALKGMPIDPADPSQQGRIDALAANLANLSPRDAEFARSLLAQWTQRGSLSERQWPHVDRLAAGTVTVEVEEGVYVLTDGTLITVYTTRNGHLAGKVWNGSSWEYETGAQRRAGAGRKITAEEAAAHGHATGCCVFCARELTDDRSVEVGYGPVCADKHGLPWGVAA